MPRRGQNDDIKVTLSKEGMQKAKLLIRYLSPYKFSFFFGLLFLFLGSGVFLVFPWAAGALIDVASGTSDLNMDLGDVGVILVIVVLIQSISSYLRVILFAKVSEKGMADIRKQLYKKMIAKPFSFYDTNRVGELTSRSAADVQQLQDAISITLAEFIRQVILLLAGVIYLAFAATQLLLVMLACFPVVIILALVFGRYIRKLSRKRQDLLASSSSIIEETLQAIHVVKSFANEAFEQLRYGRSIDKVVDVSLHYARIRGVFIVFIISALFGAMFFVLWWGAILVESGDMLAGQLVTFITLTAIIGGAIASLGDFYTQMLRAIGASERIMDIIHGPTEFDVHETDIDPLPLIGHIQYKDVHFSYPTRSDLPVLSGINLDIHPGTKVALVGASGGGKTTLIKLLIRLYDSYEGQICIDDQPISSFDVQALRKTIGIVPQEVILFGGTIRENISYGLHSANEDAILKAADEANAMEFIQRFPDGLDTVVGERGVQLSGGQRQRIAIARAILKNPSILLLDEATSSLDAESERLVQDALNKLMQDRTSIIIAHRLSTIRSVDCIYVLENGKIIEQGTHDQLVMDHSGVYTQLAKLQFSN